MGLKDFLLPGEKAKEEALKQVAAVEETREKTELEKTIESVNRFNENCFLFDHISQLVKLNQTISTSTPYKNFIMLNDDSGEVIQELVGKKGLDSLFYLTPAQTALLVPKIQIFKVMYKNDKSNEPYEKELIFNDFTSPKTIENITNNKMTRGDDVGIKSFEFEFAGKNPAEGGRVKCKLNLFFQNIQSLINEAPKGGVSFRDLILYNKNMYATNSSKKTRNCSVKGEDKDRAYETRRYQIKIIAGWADPVDPSGVLFTKPLLEAIRNSKTILFLTLKSYDIDFKENGAVELSLEYNGAMEGVLSSEQSNIFYLSETGKLVSKRREKEKEELKKNPVTQAPSPVTKGGGLNIAAIAKDTILGPEGSKENEATISTNPKEQKGKEFDKAVTMFMDSVDKQEKYSRVLNALQNNGKIFFTDVEEKQINIFNERTAESFELLKQKTTSGEYFTSEKMREIMLAIRNQRRDKNSKLEIKRASSQDVNDFGIVKGTMAKAGLPQISTDTGAKLKYLLDMGEKITIKNNTGEGRDKIIDSGINNVWGKDAKTPEGKKRINFFFLGDLMDVVLNVLTSPDRPDNHNMKVILGPFIFDDPDTGQKVEYNLADIPISLNIFLTWYMDKVIRPQKEKYLLSEFIKDVISELIVPILEKERCYFDIGGTSPHLSMGLYSVPDNGNAMSPGKRYKLSDLRAGREKTSSGGKYQDIKKLIHYLYIFVFNDTMKRYNGNYAEDTKRGVYHLVLGADRGLVRGIKFSKQAVPRGAEMMATADTSDQRTGFAGYFNAHITMVGNTVFNLGTRIFIDASKITSFLGDRTAEGTLAHQLRIGGYYKVIKIGNSVSKDDNITEIEAKWENSDVDTSCTSVEKMNQRKEKANETLRTAYKTATDAGVELVDKAKRLKTGR